jgi:hypothetical protein
MPYHRIQLKIHHRISNALALMAIQKHRDTRNQAIVLIIQGLIQHGYLPNDFVDEPEDDDYALMRAMNKSEELLSLETLDKLLAMRDGTQTSSDKD